MAHCHQLNRGRAPDNSKHTSQLESAEGSIKVTKCYFEDNKISVTWSIKGRLKTHLNIFYQWEISPTFNGIDKKVALTSNCKEIKTFELNTTFSQIFKESHGTWSTTATNSCSCEGSSLYFVSQISEIKGSMLDSDPISWMWSFDSSSSRSMLLRAFQKDTF